MWCARTRATSDVWWRLPSTTRPCLCPAWVGVQLAQGVHDLDGIPRVFAGVRSMLEVVGGGGGGLSFPRFLTPLPTVSTSCHPLGQGRVRLCTHVTGSSMCECALRSSADCHHGTLS